MPGAAAGMLAGGLSALGCTTLINLSDLNVINLSAFWPHWPLIRILCEQPAIWTVPLAIITMIIVSKATAKLIPADIEEKMLVLHAPEALGYRKDYIADHAGH